MPWFKLDDTFHSHPKVVAAGNEAAGLYVRCGSYAAQHLTDGFIAEHIVVLYGGSQVRSRGDAADGKAETLAETLVRCRLWRRMKGGYKMPDYLQYNPSKTEVKESQRKHAEAGRKGGLASGNRRRRHEATASAGASPPLEPPAPRAGKSPSAFPAPAANGRAAPKRGRRTARPPWCGTCDPDTRQVGDPDKPQRCPRCHALADGAEAREWQEMNQ